MHGQHQQATTRGSEVLVVQAQLLHIIHDPWHFLTFLHSDAASTFVGNDEDAPSQCDFLVYVGDAPPKPLFFLWTLRLLLFHSSFHLVNLVGRWPCNICITMSCLCDSIVLLFAVDLIFFWNLTLSCNRSVLVSGSALNKTN